MADVKIKIQKDVLDEGLCSVCGTCIALCPQNCISINKEGTQVVIDNIRCVSCGICSTCCPSLKMLFGAELNKKASSYDSDIGGYEYFFVGHACDTQIRKNGASGGMVTALCAYLLDDKIVDGVICADFNGYDGNYRIVYNSYDLYKSQKSFYVPIPLNKALREVMHDGRYYAVVGTPCQLQGLKQVVDNFPNLHVKIRIRIGLFCGYVQEKSSIAYLASYLGCIGPEWQFLGWRCGEYPGYVAFKHLNDDVVKQLNIYDAYAILIPFFSLHKCFLCPDGTNESADISFGDVHSFGNNQNIGILRDKNFEHYISEARSKGYIYYSDEDQVALLHNVRLVVGPKRRLVIEQILQRTRSGKNIQDYNGLLLRNTSNIILRYFYRKKACMIEKLLSNDTYKNNIMRKPPHYLFHLGEYIYKYPESSFIYQCICKIARLIKNAYMRKTY